jgi:hypothetical protein
MIVLPLDPERKDPSGKMAREVDPQPSPLYISIGVTCPTLHRMMLPSLDPERKDPSGKMAREKTPLV